MTKVIFDNNWKPVATRDFPIFGGVMQLEIPCEANECKHLQAWIDGLSDDWLAAAMAAKTAMAGGFTVTITMIPNDVQVTSYEIIEGEYRYVDN